MVVYDFPEIFRDTSNTNSKTFSANRLSSFTAERPQIGWGTHLQPVISWAAYLGKLRVFHKGSLLGKIHPFNSPLLGNLIITCLSQIHEFLIVFSTCSQEASFVFTMWIFAQWCSLEITGTTPRLWPCHASKSKVKALEGTTTRVAPSTTGAPRINRPRWSGPQPLRPEHRVAIQDHVPCISCKEKKIIYIYIYTYMVGNALGKKFRNVRRNETRDS